jgi:transcriptional regulator NrdR family protein
VQKVRQAEKRESVKRAKTSYEIAGVYYLDINKVKSKSRAILNLKKDGERVEGNDLEFIKELIQFHDKRDAKLKDFDGIEVGTHPNFEKTRCFFIVKKDGSKEDFSVTKCIMNLE